MSEINATRVAVIKKDRCDYLRNKPFHPDTAYPECLSPDISDAPNFAYEMIRESFHVLGLDNPNYGTNKWNPLGVLIRPGETVFLKPNLLTQSAKYQPAVWEHVITNGSVMRAVCDYVYKALHGDGKIIIADGPQTDSKIDLILERTGIPSIQEFFWERLKFEVQFIDLRNEFWIEKDGILVDTVKLKGDPRGNVRFDLGSRSYLAEMDPLQRKYYGAFYDISETNAHHSGGRHEYLLSRSAVEADVFINLPKLKSHKKVGLTLNLKNLVGINGNKNWLPHYALGSPEQLGDQFDKLHLREKIENSLVLRAKKTLLKRNKFLQHMARRLRGPAYKVFGDTESVVRSGNWHGNDTCWRMSLDLNRLLLYGNPDGSFRPKTERKRYMSVVDGIIGMDGNGPSAGDPFHSGLIIAGFDPLNADAVTAKLIGFDYNKISLLKRSYDASELPIAQNRYEAISVLSNRPEYNKLLVDIHHDDCLRFRPHFAWKGHIELN